MIRYIALVMNLPSPSEIILAAVHERLENESIGARQAEVRYGLTSHALHGILSSKRKIPSVDRASEICRALGLEFYIGPPRHPENLRLGAPEGETGLLTPARLPELERSVHTLARLVADAGGDPIPEDLRPALADPDGPAPVYLVSADDLDGGSAPPGTRQIEVRELAVAAGGGALELDETVTSRLAFRRDWLERHQIDPTRCTVIGVKGESMEPTLPDGCSILVDRGRRRRLAGRIYVVRSPDEGIVVKRMDKDDSGAWLLDSDHPEWDPVPWPSNAEMIGEVRWVARTFG